MFEEKISVQIFGQTFDIVGDPAEALHYTALARYVESKMKEVQDASHIVSTQKIAVLAALNIADELFRERDHKSSAGTSLEQKHEELIRALRQALEEPADSKPVPQQLSL